MALIVKVSMGEKIDWFDLLECIIWFLGGGLIVLGIMLSNPSMIYIS